MRPLSKAGMSLITALLCTAPLGAVESSACTIPAGATLPSCHEGAEVEIRNCWQRTIIATRTLVASYKTMKLKVTFTHPATGHTKSVYAFYDGVSGARDLIRIRSSFDDLGAWNYSLACEAGDCQTGTGLTNIEVLNRSLTVTGLQAPSTNALFTKGHPTVAELWTFTYPPQHVSNGPLMYADGEPFLWLGDSAWAAPLRSLPTEWVSYVNNRKAKGFSVVQIAIAPLWAGRCIESDIVIERQPPFSDQPSGSSCSTPVSELMEPPGGEAAAGVPEVVEPTFPSALSVPNPAFWKRYEEMIQYANCQGLTVLVAGIMKPVNNPPTFAIIQPFARNLAARLSGNAVILSPGFDDTISQGTCGTTLTGPDQNIRDVGNVLATTAPHLLTTNHFGTMAGDATGNSSAKTLTRMCNYLSWTTDTWLDFWMGQSGYNENRLERITERPRTLMSGLRGISDSRFSSTLRPVVNAEAAYDAGNDPQAASPHHKNRFRARQAGWLSWLSGATGYTFGAQGIWEWGVCGLNPPPIDPPTVPPTHPDWCIEDAQTHTSRFESYNRAMLESSSQDMTRLRERLLTTQWWRLVVNEQSRIRNQPIEPVPGVPGSYRLSQDRMMVVARDYNWLVVYAPHNQQINLQVSAPFRNSGTFFTPRGDQSDNRSIDGTPVSGQPGVFSFGNPGGFNPLNYGNEDWILGLPRSSSFGIGWAGASTNRLEARPLTVDPVGGMALMGQLTSASGIALSTEIEISNRTKNLPFAARAARDGSGRFVLGWQERGESDADWKVWLRMIDSGGNPIGTQMNPSQSTNRCRNLSLAASSVGAFVALWEEWNFASDRFELRVRSYAANGSPMTDSLPFIAPPTGQADSSPLVACDANGACVAAWERQAGDTTTAALWLASFSLASPWSMSAYEYRAATAEFVAVEHVISEGIGDFELAWENLGSGNESLGVSGVQLDSSALPVGMEYEVRGPWGDVE